MSVIEQTELDAKSLLFVEGIILAGHFKLSGTNHSDRYVAKRKLFRNRRLFRQVCQPIVDRLVGSGISTILIPEGGAETLVKRVKSELTRRGFKPKVIKATKFGSSFTLNSKDLMHIENRAIAILDDVVTSGGTISKLLRLVGNNSLVECLCLVDRSCGRISNKIELFSVVNVGLNDWHPSVCPLCRDDVPMNERPYE